jgi:hypothetical protein
VHRRCPKLGLGGIREFLEPERFANAAHSLSVGASPSKCFANAFENVFGTFGVLFQNSPTSDDIVWNLEI